jgi:exodeoxyribonuclease VII small subunit
MGKVDISYAKAIKQIEEILEKIENEELDVDELTSNVKKAADLLKICKSKLHDTEEEIQKILDEMDTKGDSAPS